MNVSDSPQAPFSFSLRHTLLAALLCLVCSNLLAQANPNYTSDMPSVERVKAEIKGSDPTDTLARQVAVFTYMQAYIQRIKYNRTVTGPYTPEETRLLTAYSLAAYQMSQDYAKTHTPDEAKAFERLHGQYEMNSEFYKDWTKRLIGPQSANAYKNMEGEMGARQQKHYDQEMTQYKQDRAAQQAADRQAGGGGLSDDPTAVATRRCLELGGSSIACMGKGMGAGFMDLIGFHPEDLTGPGRAGVVLFGRYRNPAALASLDFGPDTVSIVDCGKLVADGHSYTIEKHPGSLRVVVDNEPRPVVLAMRQDGGLSGPGVVDVKGRIIIGYHTVTETLYVNGQPAVGGSCGGVCQTSTTVPDYAPKMERCTIGSLGAPPKPKPAAAQPASGADSGVMGMLTGILDTGEMKMDFVPGLRMIGQYGGGRLLLDFTATSVILDCGQAHIRGEYTVENSPDQLLVHVENPGGPFTLAVEPDNSLRGTGSTTVNGKLVTGMKGEDITYRPHSESCDVATFRPKTGSAATTVASGGSSSPPPGAPPSVPVRAAAPVAYASSPSGTGAPPAPPAAAPASSVAPSSAPSSSTRAAMRVAIVSSFPSGTNPIAGKPVYLMRDRIDDVLRKLGVAVPANSTPGKAMQTLAETCRTTNCSSVMAGLNHYFASSTTLDAAGKATISTQAAATGAYYFFAIVRTAEVSMVWDIPANLVAGDNTVTLSAANAEQFH